MNNQVKARAYFAGMGEAVADRTVNRRIFTSAQIAMLSSDRVLKINLADKNLAEWMNAATLSGFNVIVDDSTKFTSGLPKTRMEDWGDVSRRVALGNVSLVDDLGEKSPDFAIMQKHLRQASLLMSGRHLQHGDENQKNRPMEVFTNCSTSAATFLSFYLLLNGSGVGRSYDDAMMKVDWRLMPNVVVVIDADYPDRSKMIEEWNDAAGDMVSVPMVPDVMTPDEAAKKYGKKKKDVSWFDVPDSRGGWAKGFELVESMAYEGDKRDHVLVLNYTAVRPNGSPIRGMQNRPSSGPGPVMRAMIKLAGLRMCKLEPWEATMFADHFAAECVLVGGARRAARMSTKTWRDRTVLGFISIKRRHGLYTSNNSVAIDDEFRSRCKIVRQEIAANPGKPVQELSLLDEMDLWAWTVLLALAEASYYDGTGEPGIINQDRLTAIDDGIESYLTDVFAGSREYTVNEATYALLSDLAQAVLSSTYTMITNPCGEIALLMLGAYCVIADVVPFHTENDEDAEEAFRVAVRALIRTNTMDSLYNREVARTNRIGVGMTGFHEWVYARFGFTWYDLIDEQKSQDLWQLVARFKRAVVDECETYSAYLGVTVPHTNTTMKPAGTTSKLFGLSEGAHLPSMRWFLRWVQFRFDDPLVETYRSKGYPVRDDLKTYPGTKIVGFPTAPKICELDGGDWVVTAAEATPEEQYQYLRLLEKYWITGVEEDGVTPLSESGNQVSYTLKYNPEVVDFQDFLNTLIDGQFSVRCCSVMPQTDTSGTAYEYLPEEPITREQYAEMMLKVEVGVKEDIGLEHVDCGTGACPIDFGSRQV